MIFPEGTRTGPGSTKRYKTGGARLAVRTGAFAVPIAVNSGELWPRNAFIRRPGVITVVIGPPIDPRGKTADDVGPAVESWIETEMRTPCAASLALSGQNGGSASPRSESGSGLKKLKVVNAEQLSLALCLPDAAIAAPTGDVDDPRSRRLQLGAEIVSYRLRRARRRSIGFQIDDQGLTVSAPRWVPLREIESAIAEKRRWITNKQPVGGVASTRAGCRRCSSSMARRCRSLGNR